MVWLRGLCFPISTARLFFLLPCHVCGISQQPPLPGLLHSRGKEYRCLRIPGNVRSIDELHLTLVEIVVAITLLCDCDMWHCQALRLVNSCFSQSFLLTFTFCMSFLPRCCAFGLVITERVEPVRSARRLWSCAESRSLQRVT